MKSSWRVLAAEKERWKADTSMMYVWCATGKMTLCNLNTQTTKEGRIRCPSMRHVQHTSVEKKRSSWLAWRERLGVPCAGSMTLNRGMTWIFAMFATGVTMRFKMTNQTTPEEQTACRSTKRRKPTKRADKFDRRMQRWITYASSTVY